MGYKRLLSDLRPLARRLAADVGDDDMAAVSWVVDGVDVRPWIARVGRGSAELFAAVMEAASLVASADGHLDAEERRALEAAMRVLSEDGIFRDDAAALLDEFAIRLRRDGLAARCDVVGRALAARDAGEPGVYLAAAIACVSEGLSRDEIAALERIAVAAGLGFPAVAAFASSIRARLAAPD